MNRLAILGLAILIAAALLSRHIEKPKVHQPVTTFNFLSTSSIDALRTLDPSLVRAPVEYIIIDNLTTRLLELDEMGQYKSMLAEKIDLSPDKRSVTIHLARKSFSSGEPIMIEDVAGTIKRLIVNGSPHTALKQFLKGGAGLKSIQSPCEGIRIMGPSTLVLIFNYPVKDILYYLQLGDYGILHKSQYSKDRALTPADWKTTSGPYSLAKEADGLYFMRWNKSYGPGLGRIQKARVLVSTGGDALVSALAGREMQIGMVGFRDYYRMMRNHESTKHVEMLGSKYQALSMLLLNVNNFKFQSLKTRQWLQRRVLKHLAVPAKYQNILEKSHEYFVPAAPGYVDPSEIRSIVEHFEVDTSVPPELKDGIRIRCRTDWEAYLPDDLGPLLQEALGIKVRIAYDIPLDKFGDTVKNRDFEAMLMNPSLSYKVLGESIGWRYLNEPRYFLDPSGEVKKHLFSYNTATDKDQEIRAIRNIIFSMTRDSEIIPLFYTGFMGFYDKDLLDASEASFLKFYELRNYRVR